MESADIEVEGRGERHAGRAARAVVLKEAATAGELAGYFALRREVFVLEQGLFSGSDLDEHDALAIPIVALLEGEVVGVVRCYRKSRGIWYGGRLAVHRQYRTGTLGARLVRRAVETMERRGDVRRFFATVQVENVRFFERLGWEKRGQVFRLQGHAHQLMEKPLGRGTS
ncbi:MAG TPA: MSMEG_0567/Sll0786 family nitrogen starvation N-acetyltransferase [Anaeromyxobacteraceae bacterium]|nr:MSMEG_0567/Sll0786 family nitrogen starvation N-acetyltransferase [Anaeromyxobacteraceae bacterium]